MIPQHLPLRPRRCADRPVDTCHLDASFRAISLATVRCTKIAGRCPDLIGGCAGGRELMMAPARKRAKPLDLCPGLALMHR